MRVNDAITGLVLVLFSVAIFSYSTTFPKLFGMQFSAGFWPQLLSVMLAGCGISLIFTGIRARAAGVAWLELDKWWKQSGTLSTVAMVPGATLFYIFASDYLGFIICSLIIIFVLAYRFGLSAMPGPMCKQHWRVAVSLSSASLQYNEHRRFDSIRGGE